MVELRGVSLSYPLAGGRKAQALLDVNARFEEGSLSAIIGPSGCGKTSIVKIIAGLLRPTKGDALVGGAARAEAGADVAVIFQDYGLLPWKTVLANALLPLRLKGKITEEGRRRVGALLGEFGLSDFAALYPAQLSGGMKQRLAIVRALAQSPRLLLMDEPFSSLDALAREEAQDFLLAVQRERRLTSIIVTHSIEEAAYLADSVHVMRGLNPGAIAERLEIQRAPGLSRAAFRDDPGFALYCARLRRALR
ncbi:MAG: ATP-binding cassette domain-containing protein [Treponema sp.]|nr:ATP-binding cassette domain-containing protein [Treponema sp.]